MTAKASNLTEKVQGEEEYYKTLKEDAIEDAKTLFNLERKMKAIDVEFEMAEEHPGKNTVLEGTLPSQMDTALLKQLSDEELEAKQRAEEILGRLREKLEATPIKDMDMQKLIERLPTAF